MLSYLSGLVHCRVCREKNIRASRSMDELLKREKTPRIASWTRSVFVETFTEVVGLRAAPGWYIPAAGIVGLNPRFEVFFGSDICFKTSFSPAFTL